MRFFASLFFMFTMFFLLLLTKEFVELGLAPARRQRWSIEVQEVLEAAEDVIDECRYRSRPGRSTVKLDEP